MASSSLNKLKRHLDELTLEANSIVVQTTGFPPEIDANDKDANITSDPNRAGHAVGLHLFGTSDEYRIQMEHELEGRIATLEREVLEIREGLAGMNKSDDVVGDDTHAEDKAANSNDGMQLEGISHHQLKNHVKFLRLCHAAHVALESLDRPSSQPGNAVLPPFSPTDMLFSPTEDKVRFEENHPTGNQAAVVMEVERALEEALVLLLEDDDEEGLKSDSNDEQDKSVQLRAMQSAISDELQLRLRRKKMELRYLAVSTLDKGIQVQTNKLVVRIGDDGSKNKVNFLDVPITPREPAAADDNNNNNNSDSPLHEAYAVLSTFQNDQYPFFGETLDRALRTIGTKLLNSVSEIVTTLSSMDEKDRTGYYMFKTERVKNIGGKKKKYETIGRGPCIALVWECKEMELTTNTSAFEGHPDNIVSTSSQITETDFISSPSPGVARFLSCLNFTLQLLQFVHRHVLLRRNDLAKLLGNYLFGTYPIDTSLSSGSAQLGGMLLGYAAQGEEGEIRPLAMELVRCMRSWCIPEGSCVEVWRIIPRIRDVLVREVMAFEDGLVEMGYMTCHQGGVPGKFAGASSPSGLSVLMNEDGVVDSPMGNNFLTVDPGSPIDVSSPPADSESNKSNKAIRSSLSEVAHNFIQAYSENRRSQILNRARSILVNTDYHNSVQVGKFVPPPAEPGTIEHLNEDPLNLFAFHRCSISTTAQKTLELVRQTLDEAIQPEMAVELDALPPMLYRASREVLDLFRAMVPTLYASEIGSIPRMAAILHNDCVYLAHEASLLGAEYKRKFKSDDEKSESKTNILSKVCTFVDMVPPFRELANKSMGSMLEAQKSQLFDLISPRLTSFKEALSSNESVSEWDDAETALRAALYHLRHLAQSWSQVLSREVYHLAIGNLVDTIFTLLLDPILSAEAITDASSRFVHSLFLDAARGSAEVFLVGDSAVINPATNPVETSQQIEVATNYCVLFGKLQCIGQFMVMRLDDITRGLEEGVFRSVTGKELTHLITAAYDESAKRNALLKALASK